jgi:hypothetical protein
VEIEVREVDFWSAFATGLWEVTVGRWRGLARWCTRVETATLESWRSGCVVKMGHPLLRLTAYRAPRSCISEPHGAGGTAVAHTGSPVTSRVATSAGSLWRQAFGPEAGRRARGWWRRLGSVDVIGNLSARPTGRDFEVGVAFVGIQLLLADTGDATTGEMVTSWPGSDGPPRQ